MLLFTVDMINHTVQKATCAWQQNHHYVVCPMGLGSSSSAVEWSGSIQEPVYRRNVIYIEDYRPDEDFKIRVAELLDGMTDQIAADRTGLNRNHIRDLREGRAKAPTYNMLRKLVGLRRGKTISWLAEGRDEDEPDELEPTMDAFWGWEQKITAQRKRFVERILAQQEAMAARHELASAAKRLAAETLADSQQASGRSTPEADSDTPDAAPSQPHRLAGRRTGRPGR
ncbi:MAG: hypothetical protein ACRESF_16365 [Pseudomonas sp.]